jgi:hypothetical protein
MPKLGAPHFKERHMHITIESAPRSRTGVVPYDGIHDEQTLIKSLILTLALERNLGAEELTLKVELSAADAELLVELAKNIDQVAERPSQWWRPYVGPSGDIGAQYLKEARRTRQLLDALQQHVLS